MLGFARLAFVVLASAILPQSPTRVF
jgi:hypothetical protein